MNEALSYVALVFLIVALVTAVPVAIRGNGTSPLAVLVLLVVVVTAWGTIDALLHEHPTDQQLRRIALLGGCLFCMAWAVRRGGH